MPSNKDIVKAIVELSEKLEKDAPETDGKNNGELANILSELKAENKAATETAASPDDEAKEKADAAAKEKADDEAKEKADDEAKEKAKPAEKPPFYVAPGKAITSKRGILATEGGAEIDAYTEIKADDLAGGKGALDAFVKSGHIAKR